MAKEWFTDDVTPLLHLNTGSTDLPSLSTGFEMLKTARMLAIFRNNDISARWAPGHTLLPNPKTNLNGSTCGLSPTWREGSKLKGSGYAFSSCAIPLVYFISIRYLYKWKKNNLPYVSYDSCSLGTKIIPINVILYCSMRQPQRSDRAPTKNLLDHCFDVR